MTEGLVDHGPASLLKIKLLFPKSNARVFFLLLESFAREACWLNMASKLMLLVFSNNEAYL